MPEIGSIGLAIDGPPSHPSRMTKTLEELLKLPAAERAEIAISLWDSITESTDPTVLPLTAAQQAELERRLAEHERDPNSALPWDEVRRRLLREP